MDEGHQVAVVFILEWICTITMIVPDLTTGVSIPKANLLDNLVFLAVKLDDRREQHIVKLFITLRPWMGTLISGGKVAVTTLVTNVGLVQNWELKIHAIKKYSPLCLHRIDIKFKLFKSHILLLAESVLLILYSKVNLFMDNCVDGYDLVSILVDAVPSVAEMEDVMRFHIKPLYVFAIFGVPREYSISCPTLLVIGKGKSIFFNSLFRIKFNWKVRNYGIFFCDQKVMYHSGVEHGHAIVSL